MSTKTAVIGLGLAVVIAIAAITLIGGDDEDDSSAETDGAFVSAMVPHHESAIEMAEIARDRAEHPEIASLAEDIIAAQSSEIETLNAINQRLNGEAVDASAGSSMMGMSAEEMGMSGDTSALLTAKPFDREFIDMMIPHHQGAIVMARMELDSGTDDEAKALAEDIIAAQSTEIEQMNEWRTQWYGGPSPAGGVPSEDEMTSSHSMESM